MTMSWSVAGMGVVVLLVALFHGGSASSAVENDAQGTLNYIKPDEIRMSEGEQSLFSWNSSVPGVTRVNITNDDEGVITIGPHHLTTDASSSLIEFNITAQFLGYSNVTIVMIGEDDTEFETREVKVSVVVSYQLVNQIYMGVLGVLLFVVFINMGAVFDASVFKAVAKNPVGPLVGLFSQFVAMPLIAFGLSKLFFPDEPLWQLGMFLCGTVPGGGTSNMWTYLIGGNFDLSLIMTAVSSMVAFGAIPAWTVIMGPYIAEGTDIVVPVTEIVLLVLGLVVPCGIGFVVQRFLPRLAKIFEQMLTPLILFIFVFTLTYGAYANRFIFRLLTWKLVLAGLSLPALGYGVGSVLAYVFRCPKRDVIAVSIETGIQNVTLAVFMLNYSLPQPASTIAIAMPGCAAIMTPVPVLLIGLALHAHAGNITWRNWKILVQNISKCQWNFTAQTFQREPELKVEPTDKSELELKSLKPGKSSNNWVEGSSSYPISNGSINATGGIDNETFDANEK